MTTAEANTLSRIQDRIAERIGPQRYKIWFKNTTHFSLADGYLRVGVPNLFIGGWVENHFLDDIAESTREIIGRSLNVTFVIDAQLNKNLQQTQLDSQADFIKRPNGQAARATRNRQAPARRPLRGRLGDFVVGHSNQMAFAAASAVVHEPGSRFNPLFIHGGCGLGKTHLLQGIVNGMLEQHRSLSCLYLSGEEFTNEFVYAIKNARISAFQRRYRGLDVLVVDDVHFLAGKKATQEQFLHTFNAIDAVGKQVVMASDAHPKMIGQLSESLVNRFVSGMVVKIEAPDLDTRREILRQRATAMGHPVPEPVVDYIASNIQTNIRELEGALLKLVAYASLAHQPISIGLAEHALADHFSTTSRIITASQIENTVAAYFGLSPADLHTSRKSRTIALARGIAMLLCRRHTRMSYPEIGRFLGNKNHSTVIQACRKLERILAEDGAVNWRTPAGPEEMSLQHLLRRLEEQIGTP